MLSENFGIVMLNDTITTPVMGIHRCQRVVTGQLEALSALLY